MSKPQKRRADLVLVELGLAESQERAQALIMAGRVSADGKPVFKPGQQVKAQAKISVALPPPYVGRGGVKLAHSLEEFHLDPRDAVALDVGASTGGFTDCLLQRGARRVYALDVGYGQLHQRLRTDPRVTVMERLNARYPFPLPEPVDIATVDVSFISLTLVLLEAAAHVKQEGAILALVKPQFEAERRLVDKGGLVRDPKVHAGVLAKIIVWAVEHGLRLRGLTPSPILGDAGNQEFFLWLQREAAPPADSPSTH
ncbi:MAG: TlyA family RNA methyltransferase [Chloroflexi bacterium]|nr:TlyA family RNA methyltransferase [Chloroflexota bacterium]